MAKRGRKRKRKDDDDPVVDMTHEVNRFRYVIPEEEDTPVTNQKQEGTCQKWACADMTSIVLRSDFPGLVTSPQVIIDANPLVCDLIPLCVHQDFGLESVNDYPVIRIGRNYPYWDGSMYQTSQWKRYRLQGLVYCEKPNEMKGRILGMFCDGGYRLPCLGVMRMGRLLDKVVARHHATGALPPYRHPEPYRRARASRLASRSRGQQHAMLIVGVDTTSDDINDHYCVVKNTHGGKWGDRGRSRVAFEVFEYVMFPVYKGQEERDNLEREKRERRRKKWEKKEKEKEEGKKVEEKSEGGDAGGVKDRVEEEPEGRNDGGDAGGGGSVEKRKNVEEIPDGGDDSGVASGGGSIKKRKKVEGGPEGGDAGGGGSVIKRKNEQEKEKSGDERNDKGEVGAGVGVGVVARARSSKLLGSDFLVPKESDI